MATNNSINTGKGTTGTVLIGNTGSDDTFSATPSVTSIKFGAGTALSTYQEGTFTPTLFGASTAGATTYVTQTGLYTKIGRQVNFSLFVQWSAATGTGIIVVGALPFVANSSLTYFPVTIYTSILVTTATSLAAIMQGSATSLIINGFIASTGAVVTSSLAANTSGTLYVNGSYIT